MAAVFITVLLLLVYSPEAQKRRRESNARIDPNARCPFCGQHHGKIMWSEASKTVIHTCSICNGQFSEKPVVDFDAWARVRQPVEIPRPAPPQGGSGVPRGA